MTEREKKWPSASGTTPILTPSCAPSGTKRPARCLAFNNADPRDAAEKARLQKLLLPNAAEGAHVTAPFQTDYGYNCYIGTGTDINRGAYLMDGAKITIGEHCFIGPNCGMYTANHPLCYAERNRGFEGRPPPHHRGQRLDRRGRDHPARRDHRLGRGDRRGQRRHQGYPRRYPGLRQPLQAPPPPSPRQTRCWTSKFSTMHPPNR